MRTAALLATLALALVAARTAGAAGPVVSYTITSGTTGDNGWYRSAVTAQLAVQGATDSDCPLVKTFKSSADALSCSATDGTSTVQFHLQFKIDTDAPTVTSATPDRAPDGGGWYSHPVTVAFAGTDPTSGIAGCTSATYSGPDSGSASVAGSCRDNAGNVGTTTTTIRYDATPPAVTATPSRKADANGWYSHAVGVSFAGTDAGSGIGSCTAPLSYSGPDTAQATVTGGCVDAAGNRGTASVTFRYDTTAPKLANVAVAVASRSATLTWREPADTASVTITRRPGRNGRRASVVYRGRASRFTDTELQPGAAYRYELASRDAAGNAQAVAVAARVPALYLPAPGARVHAGAVLAWAPVRGASYYNLQLFRGTHKILSVWPRRPRLRLPLAWTYGGAAQRLAPGRYRWFVWPGRGPLKAGRYGSLLGGSVFVVR